MLSPLAIALVFGASAVAAWGVLCAFRARWLLRRWLDFGGEDKRPLASDMAILMFVRVAGVVLLAFSVVFVLRMWR